MDNAPKEGFVSATVKVSTDNYVYLLCIVKGIVDRYLQRQWMLWMIWLRRREDSICCKNRLYSHFGLGAERSIEFPFILGLFQMVDSFLVDLKCSKVIM